jgi:hypothetical protein
VSTAVQRGVSRARHDGVEGVLVERGAVLQGSSTKALGSVLDAGDRPSTLWLRTDEAKGGRRGDKTEGRKEGRKEKNWSVSEKIKIDRERE